MRLSSQQIQEIVRQSRAAAGDHASVWLYGSRLDDQRRGGDVDLLIDSTPRLGMMERARLKVDLESALALPVDIVSADPLTPASPFVEIARATGRLLDSGKA